MNELEGVLTIKNEKKELIAIVYNNMDKRAQTFYKVEECGAEDIMRILDTITQKHHIMYETKKEDHSKEILKDID